MSSEEKKKVYVTKTRDERIKNYLSKKENVSETIEKLLLDYITGELIPKSESVQGITEKEQLDIKYKILRNEKLIRDIALKDLLLSYQHTFKQPPTPEAMQAMSANSKQSITQMSLRVDQMQEVYNYFTNKNKSGSVSCNECTSIYDNQEQLKPHLHAVHSEAMKKYIAMRFQ